MLRRLALLGRNISHSRSPELYRRFLGPEIQYDLIDVAREEDVPSVESLRQRYQGVSITTPWKKVFASYAESAVSHLGAVNCLSLTGATRATNTDWTALRELLPGMLKLRGNSAGVTLLGNGVMAGLVRDVCQKHSIPLVQYARSLGHDLDRLELKNALPSEGPQLLVNACGRSYVFGGNLRGAWTFWDFNYAHPEQESAQTKSNVSYLDGQSLLELQAKHAIQFWNRTLSH